MPRKKTPTEGAFVVPSRQRPEASLLSQTAVYAMRAMLMLARLEPGESARATDLARQTGVPLHYLSKVLRRLVESGLLVGQKGHRGGFSLSRPPTEIRFMDVLAALDQLPPPNRCAFGWGRCDPHKPCPLHPAWSKLNDAFRDWAGTMTLGDIS